MLHILRCPELLIALNDESHTREMLKLDFTPQLALLH